jgi:hypothetical protein
MATGYTTGVQFLAGARDLPLFHRIQSVSGVHPAPYPEGKHGLFSGWGGKVTRI